MPKYKDENGNEIGTEFGGLSDNSVDPDGRAIPKTTGQLAEDMRREGLSQRNTQRNDEPPRYGRRVGGRRF